MEQEDAVTPVEAIAQRVREARNRKGMTAQELADRLKASGLPWDRGTVTKVETGRRQNVSVVEWLTLARVLDVAPVNLLVPLEDVDFQVTPKESVPADRARAWIRGWASLSGTDQRIFRSEVPLGELGEGRIRPATEEERYIARKALGVPEKTEADDGE